MLKTTWGTKILNGLFNTAKNEASKNTVTFPATPYMGLLTARPGADGSGGNEVSSGDYKRVLLTGKGLYGEQMIASAETETDENNVMWAYVENTDDVIAFPYSEKDAYGQIVAFGIFEGASTTSYPTPYAWGMLGTYNDNGVFTETPVTVAAGEVPIFLKKKFKFRMA